MNFLKGMFRTFVCVLAGITICSTLFITLFVQDANLSIWLLWQIIAMSAVSSLGNAIYYSKKELNKNQMKVRILLHFIYTIVIVFGGAYLFEWLETGYYPELLVMLLMIIIVYTLVTLFMFRNEAKEADMINYRLRKFYPEEEEKE